MSIFLAIHRHCNRPITDTAAVPMNYRPNWCRLAYSLIINYALREPKHTYRHAYPAGSAVNNRVTLTLDLYERLPCMSTYFGADSAWCCFPLTAWTTDRQTDRQTHRQC